MSDDNKEGAAEPVAWRYKIGKGYEYRPFRLTHYFWDDVNERYIQGEPLYAAPPAVMPAAPSDAVTLPAYGVLPWATVRAYVEAATGSAPIIDPDYFIGHQVVGINFNSLNRIMSALAAPGAAIAAREQDEHGRNAFARYIKDTEECAIVPDVAGAFHWAWTHAPSRDEAPSTPQGEAAGLSEVTERYCNKCGYFGPDQIHYRPNGLGECGYIARIRTQPTTVQQEPDPLLIDSMCMRWRHDFGLQRDADDQLSSGLTVAERDSLRRSMRQLWEEVVGRGFYRPAALKGMQPGERKEGAE